ncbi:MAG: AAA family ATPase [Armatimonadetes bacterium]|nr:AAA family ATPase [Armatimonadota bacterium]
MASPVDQELETLIRARYPIIYIVSWEEKRVEDTLREIAQNRSKKVFVWTITQGMLGASNVAVNQATRDPISALDFVLMSTEPAIFILKDYHTFLNDSVVVRRLRDLTTALKTTYKTLIILSPILKLPAELEKDITVIDYYLPTIEELGELLDGVVRSVKENPQIEIDLAPEMREQILKAAQGLTANEAENVFAKSLVEKRKFDVEVILTEKEQIIRKSGILEYFPGIENISNVGGLEILKEWVEKRVQAFTDKARQFGLPEPKGILLLGVQGCGKSLAAKSIASVWKLPLIRLDVGKIFSGIVGSSEENMRRAITMSESIAPCILWIDEIEKGFAGTQSSPFSDGGTTSRVFGSFITWLQEKTAPVFVVSTANEVNILPPEMLRKGRFDDIFFVDLPSERERREIFEIHLRKRKRDPAQFDIKRLAGGSDGFSGAEIEQAIIAALYEAFDQGRDLTTDDILGALKQSIPLSQTMREKIDSLRRWAADRARPASAPPTARRAKTKKAESDGQEEAPEASEALLPVREPSPAVEPQP